MRWMSNKVTGVAFGASMIVMGVCCTLGYTDDWPTGNSAARTGATFGTYLGVQLVYYTSLWAWARLTPRWRVWRTARRLPVARAVTAPHYASTSPDPWDAPPSLDVCPTCGTEECQLTISKATTP